MSEVMARLADKAELWQPRDDVTWQSRALLDENDRVGASKSLDQRVAGDGVVVNLNIVPRELGDKTEADKSLLVVIKDDDLHIWHRCCVVIRPRRS